MENEERVVLHKIIEEQEKMISLMADDMAGLNNPTIKRIMTEKELHEAKRNTVEYYRNKAREGDNVCGI